MLWIPGRTFLERNLYKETALLSAEKEAAFPNNQLK
jgi:hypothetical protein